MTGQHFLRNSPLNPSGPGDLLLGNDNFVNFFFKEFSLKPINILSRCKKGGEFRVQTREFRNSQSFLEGGPDEMGFFFMF
jgi:hypothetical protein